MIDLNNTWCETTEENYKALIKLGIKDNYYACFNDRIKSYLFPNAYIMVYDGEIDLLEDGNLVENFKQIHLVNGEFQCVEPKPKNNFKDYGFEADFEGEICFENYDEYLVGYTTTNGIKTFKKWYKKTGICYNMNSYSNDLYNLKPIKKWYENPDNFEKYKGKLITNKYGTFRKIQYIDKNKVATVEQNMYHDILSVDEWRPATKEEVLSLLIKED